MSAPRTKWVLRIYAATLAFAIISAGLTICPAFTLLAVAGLVLGAAIVLDFLDRESS